MAITQASYSESQPLRTVQWNHTRISQRRALRGLALSRESPAVIFRGMR